MTTVTLGCVFHYEKFVFADGEEADKYFVILGAKQGSNYLAVMATSKKRKMDFVPGCHSNDGYYHIPGGGKDYFKKDTWLLLARPLELSAAEFVKLALAKTVEACGNLRADVAGQIRNCFRLCPDSSPLHIALL